MDAHESRMENLINEIDLKVFMLMMESQDVIETGSAWAAICSTTTQSARLRMQDLGGDIDKVRESIDGFFLEHPECT